MLLKFDPHHISMIICVFNILASRYNDIQTHKSSCLQGVGQSEASNGIFIVDIEIPCGTVNPFAPKTSEF